MATIMENSSRTSEENSSRTSEADKVTPDKATLDATPDRAGPDKVVQGNAAPGNAARGNAAVADNAGDEAGPDYVSIYSSSIFAVSVLFLLGVGVPTSMYLDNWLSGMALGAFCAAWGGPSFGVMAASARVSAWFEAHEDH